MAAVIRLKRRVDEDPLDAFVLNCKRQRTDPGQQQDPTDDASSSNSTGETSTVLKFAGTFPKADNIPTHLQQRLSKDEAREVISRVHRPKIASRNREASRQNAQNSRFRIVNCTRSLSQVEGVEGTTIVDVERDIIAAAAAASAAIVTTASAAVSSENSLDEKRPAEGPEEQGYVYDLYVVDDTQPQVHIPFIPDNLDDISVAIYDDPLFSSHRGLGDRSDSLGEESEDSNDENNWRNDYPDEDEDVFGDCQSVGEDDMRRAVEELDLEGDRELSSDGENEDGTREDGNSGFAYPVNDDGDDDDEYRDADDAGLNSNDVDRFGTAYARYKARIMKQLEKKQRGSDSEEYDSELGSSDEFKSSSASGSESEKNFDLYD
ncbi:probable RNA polymerase II nuclear localization protein SLC7A6OS [Ochlerotatus camptorhynchus]|uniref:probable RNA polymerase II nuclear localization protein SLC7A6OS n=1 Tax=Ochlerotatus camptorhynchus TaxID=644619 RepID=UPI0031CF56B3